MVIKDEKRLKTVVTNAVFSTVLDKLGNLIHIQLLISCSSGPIKMKNDRNNEILEYL